MEESKIINQVEIQRFWPTSKLASLFGVTGKEIQRITALGILKSKGPDGRRQYDVLESTREYITYIRDQPKQKRVESGNLENEKLQADIDLKKAKAKVAEIELQELEGTMHRSEDVEEAFNDLVFGIRSMFMAMPGRLAVDVAEFKTPAETSARIQEEVNEILNSLTEYQYDPVEYRRRVRERRGWVMSEDEKPED